MHDEACRLQDMGYTKKLVKMGAYLGARMVVFNEEGESTLTFK